MTNSHRSVSTRVSIISSCCAGVRAAPTVAELLSTVAPAILAALVVTETFPASGGTPVGITKGPDNNLWFAEFNASKIGVVLIGSPPPPQIDAEYPLPVQGLPAGIVTGPDGALWFTDWAGKVSRITTSGSIARRAR